MPKLNSKRLAPTRLYLLLLVAAFGTKGCKGEPSPLTAPPPIVQEVEEAEETRIEGSSDAIEVATGLQIVKMSLQPDRTFAFMSDGSVRTWGANDEALLGDTLGPDLASLAPVPALDGAVALEFERSSRHYFSGTTCAIVDDTVKCWGLAPGVLSPSGKPLHTPTEIPALAGAKQLCLGGGRHNCALMKDGTLNCWGNNYPNPDKTPRYTPPPGRTVAGLGEVEELQCSYAQVCARLKNGNVKCWHDNYNTPAGSDAPPNPKLVPGITKATSLAVGAGPTCAIAQGSVNCWGLGLQGGPLRIENLDKPTQLVAKKRKFCAVESAGTVKCWTFPRWMKGNSPELVPVQGLAGVKKLALGAQHSCAATSTEVLCWGENQRGELGDGTLRDRSAPTAVLHALKEELPPPMDGLAELSTSNTLPTFPEGLPKSCTNTIKIEHARLKYVDIKSSGPLSATFSLPEEYTNQPVWMEIDNFHAKPGFATREARGDQVRVVLAFRNQDFTSNYRHRLGSFRLGKTGNRSVSISLQNRGTYISLPVKGSKKPKKAALKITTYTHGYACGRLAFETDELSISGTFAAKTGRLPRPSQDDIFAP